MTADMLLGVVASLAVLWALLVALLWLVRPRGLGARELAGVVPDLVRLGRSLIADRSVPLAVRIALVALVIWLVNPVDLIPEFVPVIGPLDDLIVAVLVLRFVRRQLGVEALRQGWPGTPEGFDAIRRIIG